MVALRQRHLPYDLVEWVVASAADTRSFNAKAPGIQPPGKKGGQVTTLSSSGQQHNRGQLKATMKQKEDKFLHSSKSWPKMCYMAHQRKRISNHKRVVWSECTEASHSHNNRDVLGASNAPERMSLRVSGIRGNNAPGASIYLIARGAKCCYSLKFRMAAQQRGKREGCSHF